MEDKLLTPGQLLGYPWKLGGIKVQTSYVEGQWHQKWFHSRVLLFFCRRTRKNAPWPKIFNGKIFAEQVPTESLPNQDSENLYARQRLFRTQIIWVCSDIWVFSVLDNRLLADNLSQLQIWSKICIFGHFGPNIGIFGPLDLMRDQKTMRTSCQSGFLLCWYQNFYLIP